MFTVNGFVHIGNIRINILQEIVDQAVKGKHPQEQACT